MDVCSQIGSVARTAAREFPQRPAAKIEPGAMDAYERIAELADETEAAEAGEARQPMNTYVLDTDTLIFLIRGMKISAPRTERDRDSRARASRIFSRCQESTAQGHIVALSAITAAELEYRVRKGRRYEKEISALQKTLAPFVFLDFDGRECAWHYGQIRLALEEKGLPVGAMDLWIAAHVRALAGILITNNCRHFARLEGLRIESWD